MDYYLIAIGGVIVVAVSLGLALLSNKAEEKKVKGSNKQKQLTKKKDTKKDSKKKKLNPKQRKEESKNAFTVGTPSYDADEDDEKSMLEFLRGTQKFKSQEAKEEKKKKIRADKNAIENQKIISVKNVVSKDESDENIEYVLIKRKKAEQPPAKKIKNAEESVEGDSDKKKKSKDKKKKGTGGEFFKRGLAKDLKNQLGKPDEEEEAPVEEGKKGKKKAPKVEGEENKENVEGAANKKNNGPRQGGNTGAEDRPRKPREAPPPPPRPLGGAYEAPSLDEMLTSISTYYAANTKPKHKPEETFFSKLPRVALFRALYALSVKDIIALSRVNHSLNKICRDEKLWRFLCERDFKMKFSDKAANQKRFKKIYREEVLKNKPKSENKA